MTSRADTETTTDAEGGMQDSSAVNNSVGAVVLALATPSVCMSSNSSVEVAVAGKRKYGRELVICKVQLAQ